MGITSYIQWDDDDVHFVLDQHVCRHVAPLWHIIMIQSKPFFALTHWCCVLSGDVTNTNVIVFGLNRPCLKAMLTITPLMPSYDYWQQIKLIKMYQVLQQFDVFYKYMFCQARVVGEMQGQIACGSSFEYIHILHFLYLLVYECMFMLLV
jgi:hypothetical protein